MKSAIALGLGVAFSLSAASFAQDSIVGTYKGSFPVQTYAGDVEVGVTLVIASVEDGKIAGTGSYHRGSCLGDYPVVGILKDKAIGIRGTKKGGAAGDCAFFFKGTVDGNRLVGAIGKYDVVLRK